MTFPFPYINIGFREFGINAISGSWDQASSTTHTFTLPFTADAYCHLITCHYQITGGTSATPQTAPTADGVQMGNIDLNFIGENGGTTSTLGARSTVGDDGRALWYGHINVAGKSSVDMVDSLHTGTVCYAYLLTGITNAGTGALDLVDAIIDSNSNGNDDGGNVALRDPDNNVTTTATSFALCGASDALSFMDGVADIDDYLQSTIWGWDMDHPGGTLNYSMTPTGASGARCGSVIVFERP